MKIDFSSTFLSSQICEKYQIPVRFGSTYQYFLFSFIFCLIMIEGRANELPDFQVFRTVIKYCLIIIIVPVLSFLITKIVLFDGILRLAPVTSSVYSAVVAVIVLHITLGLYIFKAYNETEKSDKPIKRD